MPWDDVETRLMTRPLPDIPPAALPNARPEALPTIGHIGRYALKYRIGEGGLGTVYAAHDPLLSRLIAIKTLNVDIPLDARETFNDLFLNEAKAAGRLSHPHIVTVFDAGVSPQGAYIAMELLKGKDLRQLMKDGWRPTPAQAALIVRRVADALAYAHSKGVVHRDVKPANIFMIGRTQPRVLDFGIARVAQQRDSRLRNPDNIPTEAPLEVLGGSPYYMAPEQVRQEPVDRRADVYSLGIVLYELLTGERPYDGQTMNAIADAVLNKQAPPAHELNPQVPKVLSDITAKAMLRNREHRTHSARALSRELRQWLDTQSPDALRDPPPPSSKRPIVWAIGGTLAVVAALGLISWRQSAKRAPALEMPPVASAPVVQAPPASAIAAPAIEASSAASDAMAATATNASAAMLPASEAVGSTAVVSVEAGAASAANSPTAARAAEAKDTKRNRDARAKQAASRASASVAKPVALATGTVQLAVSPWGQVEVDGSSMGTAPPLNQLTLTEGRHTITIRNDAFAPYVQTVHVEAGQAISIKHRFGP